MSFVCFQNMDSKVTKRAPWPEKAKLLAMEKYIERQDFLTGKFNFLTGKFKGCGDGGVSFKEKEEIWQSIADSVNAISDTPINVVQLRKQITNIRQRANEKLDSNKKTGGGKTADFTASEKLWIEATSKKASVHGLNTSLDTEGAVCANKALTNAGKIVLPDDHDLGAVCASITVADTGKPLPDEHDQDGKAKNDVSVLRVSNYGHSAVSSTERRRRSEKELEKENLMLDNKRIKLDTERIIKETNKLEKETVKIEKETVKIEKEIENIKLKKSILEIVLSRLAEDPHSVSLLDKFDFDF